MISIFLKGGPVMWPILITAIVAVAVVGERSFWWFRESRRRSFTPQFKAQVVLEVLSGQRSASESARQHKLKPELISRWKDIALEGLEGLFEGEGQRDQDQDRIAELERMVGRLTMELEVAKKAWRSPVGAPSSRSSGLAYRFWPPPLRQRAIATPRAEFTVASRRFQYGQGQHTSGRPTHPLMFAPRRHRPVVVLLHPRARDP